MSTSLLVLEQNVGNELGRAAGTCNATGSTTTIVDTSPDSPLQTDDSSTLYQNAWAKIEADSATPALNVGEVRRVKSYTPSTQTLTLNAALSNATVSGQDYGIYLVRPPTRLGLHKGLDEYINETLRNLRHREAFLLSLVTDADMETSGVTNWTASNATVAKTTTAATYWGGVQALSVLATAANGYARSDLVNVTEGQSYIVTALVKSATTGTAKLQLYDETNGAEIESDESAERNWRYLSFEDTIPDNCTQVSVRLITETDATTIYWDNVTLLNAQSTQIDVPTWITGPNAVEELYYLDGGTQEPDLDSIAVDERHRRKADWFEVYGTPTEGINWRLEFSPRPRVGQQMVLIALRPYTELSANTSTTNANADLVKAGALARIGTDLVLEGGSKAIIARWGPEYRKLLGIHQPSLVRRSTVGRWR